MVDVHARIHAERQRAGPAIPFRWWRKRSRSEARLLCFDEFQVTDVADAMILGRLFEHLFREGVIIVATSNTRPDRLYEGGLNRQLFLPFIAEIKERLDVVELNGPTDYRLQRIAGIKVYLTPLSPEADAAMDAAWRRLTDCDHGKPMTLPVLGRAAARCRRRRAGWRGLISGICARNRWRRPIIWPSRRNFHAILLDHIPLLSPENRNEARRFVLLIDTLYDEGVKLICSAAAPPDALYPEGDGADAFRRTASRLAEMQSEDYLKRGHGIHGLVR